ncbi:hypothetical protein [Acetobacter persici]|uniref:hypothetical protein n=1 Tax=Acetobacter persici TaxID=1076596 RepID=UPI00142F4C06|nr:hypothetical protein [Acetobacter persici]
MHTAFQIQPIGEGGVLMVADIKGRSAVHDGDTNSGWKTSDIKAKTGRIKSALTLPQVCPACVSYPF